MRISVLEFDFHLSFQDIPASRSVTFFRGLIIKRNGVSLKISNIIIPLFPRLTLKICAHVTEHY